MRGDERVQDGMFSYVSLEERVPLDHPLRAVRRLTDQVLRSLSGEFDQLYAATGRRSIAPEYILRALLLQVFYSIRSERQLVEQIDYNLRFRWFVGLSMDDAVWHHAAFSKNGDRSNFHGQKRSNQTHASTTDGDARLYKKSYGKESKLSYLGHALVENRNGLISAAMVTHADGYAERDAALLLLHEQQKHRSRRITVGADKAYDTKDFVTTVRELNVTPHVTKNEKGRRSNLDRRTTRQPGYAISLSRRWLVEKGFGWLKQTGPLRQVKLRGLEKVDWLFVFSCAAHNLIRLPRLIAQRQGVGLREKCA